LKKSIPTGAADWSREIAFALADGDVVCLMWSQHTAASKWAAPVGSSTNWLTAQALEKPIMVCLLPDAPELPKPLFNLYGVMYFGNWNGAFLKFRLRFKEEIRKIFTQYCLKR